MVVLLLVSAAAFGQTKTTVTGVVQDASGNLATSGTVVFNLSPQNSGIIYFVTGTGIIAPQTGTCGIDGSGNIKNLALSGACQVWGTDLIQPANLTYQVAFFPNGVGSPTNTVAQQCITGTTYDLSNPKFCPVIKPTPQGATVITSPIQNNLIPAADAVFNLGSASLRYGNIFAANGTFTNSIIAPNLPAGTVNTGTGTTNTIPKFTNGATGVLGNSSLTDNGTNVNTPEIFSAASYANNLGAFAPTTSAQMRSVVNDESGTGVLLFANGNIGAATGSTLALTTGLIQGSIVSRTRDCRVDNITLDLTGTTDASATINTCIANAKSNGQNIIILPCGNLLINTTLNATNFPGVRITGCGFQPNISTGPLAGTKETNLLCNTGSTTWCLESEGSSGFEIDHLAMTYCCSAGYPILTNPSRGGILQGRDNAGGGGAANPFCYQEQYHIHDIYITDNGGANTTFNSSRGQVGIYNVSAEDGFYDNYQILSSTPMVFSQIDILGGGAVYQTLQTGCPASMVDAVLTKPTLAGSTVTLPLIEANITNTFTIDGILGNGGAGLIKFENLSGGAVTADWDVHGAYENASADIISTSVSLDNMHLNIQVSTPAPGFDIKVLANNLTLSNSQFNFGHLAGISPDVFINNAFTGTVINGSIMMVGGTTSASNTTVNNSTVYAPLITDANITFAAASNYEYMGSSGIITHGQRKFAIGTVAAPGISFNTASFPGTTGFYMSASHNWLQASFGGTANIVLNNSFIGFPTALVGCWFNSTDPDAGSCDTGISRDATANIIDVGNGTTGNTTGMVKAAAFISGGTAATITGTGACATLSTQTGGATVGRITCTGVTAASTLIITPGKTAPNGWVCMVQDQTTRANALQQTSTTTTACTLTATSVTQNDVMVFSATAF